MSDDRKLEAQRVVILKYGEKAFKPTPDNVYCICCKTHKYWLNNSELQFIKKVPAEEQTLPLRRVQ